MDYENRWNYSLVAELQKTLSEKNERIIQLEDMWKELKEKFQNSKQPFKVDLTRWDVLNEMKKLEKEFEE